MAGVEIGRGVWPVMLTPFEDGGAIDWAALDELVEWYIGSGAAGLFAVALSSEMYQLSPEERVALATRVVARAAGRVPVVASGTFGGSVGKQAAFVRRMRDEAGVDAVVVLSCQLAEEGESDDVWLANAERLLSLTGEAPLGLYECPVPYKRVLSPALMGWAARTDRFLFHKDTCCEAGPIAAKIAAVRGTGFRFFNANTATLLGSLEAGGDGYSGIGANFYTDLYAWLCRGFAERPEEAARLQRFLSVGDRVVSYKYPRSAKRFLGLGGLRLGERCRTECATLMEEDLLTLRHLWELAQERRPPSF